MLDTAVVARVELLVVAVQAAVVAHAGAAVIDDGAHSVLREVGARGITVNSVAPGYLETEMTHGLDPHQKLQIVRRTPLGALGTPDDVTGLVLFLLSEPARNALQAAARAVLLSRQGTLAEQLARAHPAQSRTAPSARRPGSTGN